MADPFSFATGALAVAQIGLKLHKALNEYVKGVASADKHLKRITNEVRTTSWALTELGALLQGDDDDGITIFKPEARHQTKAALEDCEELFKELKSLMDFTDNDGAQLTLPNKLKFPGRSRQIKELLRDLERLKTTLLLVCHVIPAAKVAAKKDSIPLQDQVQLEYLIKAWQGFKMNKPLDDRNSLGGTSQLGFNATQIENSASALETARSTDLHEVQSGMPQHTQQSKKDAAMSAAVSEPATRTDGRKSPRLNQHGDRPAHHPLPPTRPAPLPPIYPMPQAAPATNQRSYEQLSKRANRLLWQLTTCRFSISDLLLVIDQAILDLQQDHGSTASRKITAVYVTAKQAIDMFLAIEREETSNKSGSEGLFSERARSDLYGHGITVVRARGRSEVQAPSPAPASLEPSETLQLSMARQQDLAAGAVSLRRKRDSHEEAYCARISLDSRFLDFRLPPAPSLKSDDNSDGQEDDLDPIAGLLREWTTIDLVS